MGMKLLSQPMLKRWGYRSVLMVNTLMVAVTIASYSWVMPGSPLILIVMLGMMMGLFNSLQFSSMNSMAYADVPEDESAMASTMASTLQQMSMSFGLACGSLVTGYFLGDVPQTNGVAVTRAIHHAFWALAALTALSSLSFWRLRPWDGSSVSGGPDEREADKASEHSSA